MELVQTTFRYIWQMVVILLEGGSGYRGVGLVDILWETISGLMNHRIVSAVRYHDTLYKFRAGRGTGTVCYETYIK